ncbi:MAG: sensor domain-containing diguanylate cyclase [Woeseia sp.]|nr:sensor domain-containing diguanylate cyclase [Woeseia sp.]
MSSVSDLEQYAKFLDTLPDGALLVDELGKILLANDTAGHLFGYQSEDLPGQAVEILLPEPLRDAHRDRVQKFIAQPKSRAMGSGLQLRARRSDGVLVPVDIMLSPVDVDGIRNTVCIVRDISERRQLEADLESALEREKEISRTDPLTGAANRRLFSERLQREMDRSRRYKHPFSIAYLDLDHFKLVNDNMGHHAGDRLLATVVQTIQALCRSTDTVARVGGDEFAVLFPETDASAVRGAVDKFRAALLAEMRRNNWPVTFSIGVITCTTPPDDAQKLIGAADSLMYAVKESGRDAVRYGHFPEES